MATRTTSVSQAFQHLAHGHETPPSIGPPILALCKSEEPVKAVSPMSVVECLRVCYLGGNDAVRKQLEQYVREPVDDKYTFGAVALLDAFPPREDFLDKLRGDVLKGPTSDAIVAAANDWASDKTHGMIKNALGAATDGTVSIVMGVVYFNEKWKMRFEPSDTVQDTFQGPHSVPVQMMKQRDDFRAFGNEKVRAVALPYAGCDYVAVVVVPQKQSDLDYAVELACGGEHRSWGTRYCDVHLPKFRVDSGLDLGESFKCMGMGALFAPGALDRMTSGVFSMDVKHRVVVEVDEEGTVVAAVTAMCAEECYTPPPPEPFLVRADRPFAFAIVHKSNNGVVLTSVIYEPSRWGEKSRDKCL